MAVDGSQASIEVVFALLDAMRRQDLDAVARQFDPAVRWEGVVPGVECADRAEVLEMLGSSFGELQSVHRLELIANGDRVVLGVYSPELQEVAGMRLEGRLFNLFAVRDQRIVHVRDFRDREEALSEAGRAAP